jgi:hypothetical protein
MTRKHFKLVAEVISKIEDTTERKQMAKHNATAFAKANPRFNRSMFMAACNVN